MQSQLLPVSAQSGQTGSSSDPGPFPSFLLASCVSEWTHLWLFHLKIKSIVSCKMRGAPLLSTSGDNTFLESCLGLLPFPSCLNGLSVQAQDPVLGVRGFLNPEDENCLTQHPLLIPLCFLLSLVSVPQGMCVAVSRRSLV